MVINTTAKLTIKEVVALYVLAHPNCRGHEIQSAYYKFRYGHLPTTRARRGANGSMTSCNAGGGLAVAKDRQAYSCTRHRDRILLKDFHGPVYHYDGSRNRLPPPTFTLTPLGEEYAMRALQKLLDS